MGPMFFKLLLVGASTSRLNALASNEIDHNAIWEMRVSSVRCAVFFHPPEKPKVAIETRTLESDANLFQVHDFVFLFSYSPGGVISCRILSKWFLSFCRKKTKRRKPGRKIKNRDGTQRTTTCWLLE